jgi:hypothetical protein
VSCISAIQPRWSTLSLLGIGRSTTYSKKLLAQMWEAFVFSRLGLGLKGLGISLGCCISKFSVMTRFFCPNPCSQLVAKYIITNSCEVLEQYFWILQV